MSDRFKAPAVPVSEHVQWFRNADAPPQAAIVIGTRGGGVLALAVFESDARITRKVESRHVDDPNARLAVASGDGLWDLVPHYQFKMIDPDAPYTFAEAGASA